MRSALRAVRFARANSMVFASHTVQVGIDARSKPIITVFTATSARRNMLDSDKASRSAGGGYTGLFSGLAGPEGAAKEEGAMDVAPGSAGPVRETFDSVAGFGTASAASGHTKRCLEPSHHRPQRESQQTNRLARPRTPAWPMRCLPR
jgi:hypothetical protein